MPKKLYNTWVIQYMGDSIHGRFNKHEHEEAKQKVDSMSMSKQNKR